MNRNIILIKSLTIIFLLYGLQSCTKHDSLQKDNYLNKENNQLNILRSKLEKNSMNQTALKPTRKMSTHSVVDSETGEITVWYDCKKAGNNCDIGAGPINPIKKSKTTEEIINSDLNLKRKAVFSYLKGKNQEAIISTLDSLKSNLISIFPKVYELETWSAIKNGKFKIVSDDSFLAIVENSKELIPTTLFLYLLAENPQSESR